MNATINTPLLKYAAQPKFLSWMEVHENDATKVCDIGNYGDIRINHYGWRSVEETTMKRLYNFNPKYTWNPEVDAFYNAVEDRTILYYTKMIKLNDFVTQYGGYI